MLQDTWCKKKKKLLNLQDSTHRGVGDLLLCANQKEEIYQATIIA